MAIKSLAFASADKSYQAVLSCTLFVMLQKEILHFEFTDECDDLNETLATEQY